ncbi:hypothetical protein [Pseudomonas sp. PB106]|uniref:hypothetical protein n=1 Tax=Pseudomonas sp. PB106 TaxID=2494699 RepID=UPI00131CFAE8|nr:hypothetical protein [Pseudomonas sp. PB106]KAE9644002.1 hypothetical protein EJA71_14835 [Pseudomonas sp. PB106]
MTTEINILRVPDVAASNDVINLPRANESGDLVISAASFLIPCSSHDFSILVLSYIRKEIDKKLSGYGLYAFIGNSTWQPDTRVVRYRGLWGGLKSRGVNLIGGTQAKEVVVECDGKLKFFGMLCVSGVADRLILNAVLNERCSYLVALPKNHLEEITLGTGWTGNTVEDSRFLYDVFEKEGLLVKKVGEFDDPHKGFLAMGCSGVVCKLFD